MASLALLLPFSLFTALDLSRPLSLAFSLSSFSLNLDL